MRNALPYLYAFVVMLALCSLNAHAWAQDEPSVSDGEAQRPSRLPAAVVCNEAFEGWRLVITVTDPGGSGVPDVGVVLRSEDVVRTERTDDIGSVVLEGDELAEYHVRVDRSDFDESGFLVSVFPGCETGVLVRARQPSAP